MIHRLARKILPCSLRRHPFPVVAWFERVVAVSFAFPEEVLRPLVPQGLELDSYEGMGFVTVAIVWTKNLRPAGFPKFLGQDFFLAGYRVFATLRDESGRRLRGLKILRSETDLRRMVWLGNLMTGYNYQHVTVRIEHAHGRARVRPSCAQNKESLDLAFATGAAGELPKGSPFRDWHTARRFAGPMPFTFSPESDGRFTVVEGSRQDWTPRPVSVLDWRVAMFEKSPLGDSQPILANAFAVEGVAYRWKRGRIMTPLRP